MKLKTTFILFLVLICSTIAFNAFAGLKPDCDINIDTSVTVPLGGNAWRMDKDTIGGSISNDGIVNWSNKNAVFTAYVRIARKGTVKLWLIGKVPSGKTLMTVAALNDAKQVTVSGNIFTTIYAGEWNVTDTGYVAFAIKGISKTGHSFADISSVKLSGTAIDSKTAYVKDNDGEFFYWGRRGPSVHLAYTAPENIHAEWFYNEVTVPQGNDVLHSYFMACGFGEGYFGMQVNSPTERHILFSVWSPFKTDNPGQVPADQKIIMLKKGPNVHTGEFGSEGSGGQSYLLYNWKAGNTYKFLIHAKPDAHNYTVYTAYFFAPELSQWQLIASFSRPKTNTYLKHLHSFLENFEPAQGTLTRRVLFNNEWIANENGKWRELTKARFTVDNTGAKGYRMDYAGGILNGSFYLKNCGFFSNYTIRNTIFEKAAPGKKPGVVLDKLP